MTKLHLHFLFCSFALFFVLGCEGNASNDSPTAPTDSAETFITSSDEAVSSSEIAGGGSNSSSKGKFSSSSSKMETNSGQDDKSSSSKVTTGSSSSLNVVAESSSSGIPDSFSEKSSSSEEESLSSAECSSSGILSSSSVKESSSSMVDSCSSSSENDKESSSSEFSYSSQQSAVLDSSYYNAEENTLTDLRDGQIYKTVLIGNQIWMAQNLRIEKYGDLTIKSYCYEDNPQNCDSIGRLYIRSAAFDSVGVFGSSGKGCGKNKTACSLKKPARGICPQNWHIADSLEWVELFNEVEKNALNLMATQGWDESCYENPTNGIYGFNALPGYRGSTGKYSEWASYFWVAERNVRSFSLSCYWKSSLPIIGVDTPESAFSVRCIKDSE